MKRMICIVLVAACLCSGCGLFGPQQYTCDVDNVKSVQIVQLNRNVEGQYRWDYTVLCEIFDKGIFVNQLTSIEHRVQWGEPTVHNEGDIVVRIEFLNGEYDLIHWYAQTMSCPNTNRTGFFFFDKEQYNALIEEYMP